MRIHADRPVCAADNFDVSIVLGSYSTGSIRGTGCTTKYLQEIEHVEFEPNFAGRCRYSSKRKATIWCLSVCLFRL